MMRLDKGNDCCFDRSTAPTHPTGFYLSNPLEPRVISLRFLPSIWMMMASPLSLAVSQLTLAGAIKPELSEAIELDPSLSGYQ